MNIMNKSIYLLILLMIIPYSTAAVGLPSRICYPLSTGAFCFNSTYVTGAGTYYAGNGLNLITSTFSVNATICSGGQYSQYNGTSFTCQADAGAGSDQNNYTTSIGFNGTLALKQLNLARTGMTNLTATFTDIYYQYTHLSNFTNNMDYITSTYANNTYLKLTDQRYNETSIISAVNTSLWNNKLNLTDQRWNYTSTIGIVNTTAVNANTNASLMMSYNSTLARTGTATCSGSSVAQNITLATTGVTTQCTTPAGSSYSAGNGLTLTGTQFNVTANTCSAGNYSYYNGTGFQCRNDLTEADTGDGNNYTTSIGFNGTTDKQLNLARFGMTNLTAFFTDIDTWNTSAQMRSAVNNSGLYNITINASNILNSYWLTTVGYQSSAAGWTNNSQNITTNYNVYIGGVANLIYRPKFLVNQTDTTQATIAKFTTTSNNYGQVIIENMGNGSSTSSDLVLENQRSTETDYFLDIGLDAQNYTNVLYNQTGKTSEAYILSQNYSLGIGVGHPTDLIAFTVGGYAFGNQKLVINNTNILAKQNMTFDASTCIVFAGGGQICG